MGVLSLRDRAGYLIKEISLTEAGKGITTWKVSSKWVNRNIACSLEGIRAGCLGSCCKGNTFWPSKASGSGLCLFLTEEGCSLENKDKPITCLLYPLILNKSNTLVYHYRALASYCKKNYGKGDKVLISLRGSLSELFGEDVVDYLFEVTEEGRDAELEVPNHIISSMLREEEWSSRWENPKIRSMFIRDPDRDIFNIVRRIRLVRDRKDVEEVINYINSSDPDISNFIKTYILSRLESLMYEPVF